MMSVKGESKASTDPTEYEQQTSTAVVEAVAAATDRDPTACPPLYDVVDPDALDHLAARGDGVRVAFAYAGCDVVVRGGEVTVNRR